MKQRVIVDQISAAGVTLGANRPKVQAVFDGFAWGIEPWDISFEVPDYRRSAAFYQALFGWDVRPGNGTQASVQIGSIAGAIICAAAAMPPQPPANGRDGNDRPHQLRY